MEILGKQFIDGKRSEESGTRFCSLDAATGEPLEYEFFVATDAEISRAAATAGAAFTIYRKSGLEERAQFLEAIAEEIDSLDDRFVQIVMRETGLPEPRIRGERLRTSNQLRLFSAVVRRGDFLGARIDTALPDRQPLPRPDIRQYRIGTGPVAVFGAANFPLAFSVAGGDTASALAAGCPVVVKAHSAHPTTSELVACAVVRAVERSGVPKGVFAMLFGDNAGAALVRCPEIKAVGFTGSLAGGRALSEIAAARPEPIPVFAEMSSVNPVILLPGALRERGSVIASGLAASVTLGAGQFCTNPGLVIGIAGEPFDTFCQMLSLEIMSRPPLVMLSRPILLNYQEGIRRLSQLSGMELLGGAITEGDRAAACLFRAPPELLRCETRPLEDEVFGPVTVLVAVKDLQELREIIPDLGGHLAAGLFAAASELSDAGPIVELLETRVGRVILNEFPTGVEVCDAMTHGGPFPATSDSRCTSVGTLAIDRFLRPVCYQGYPDIMLPPALQDANPYGLLRLVNGKWSAGGIRLADDKHEIGRH
ncbi:alpha-ketoglutaric semialdehyde dehydrogenase [Geobacter sp. OR-1]|uniref:aldehyde dehydrogenase (NADP(+)) n=1 Tax=Geobacter sp. OR-1 TaxID=1266765 RepID=UPI000542FE31|nr:aldehyde dehydrogenase (NADP(+)) [Geobacter sp. OR-1]GAM07950.1 alpha-ketoglutaric semialdehyde dehydrogenase [Geobacter sp. OR-1]